MSPDPPPLRAEGVGRGHDRRALLDHRRPARRGGRRQLLLRMAAELTEPDAAAVAARLDDPHELERRLARTPRRGARTRRHRVRRGRHAHRARRRRARARTRGRRRPGAHPRGDRGAPAAASARRRARRARRVRARAVVASPGFHPDHPVLEWAGDRGRRRVGRHRARLARARQGERRRVDPRHRHERQDHDRAAHRHVPGRQRPARRAVRQHRRARARRRARPGRLRRARRGALELPAAPPADDRARGAAPVGERRA